MSELSGMFVLKPESVTATKGLARRSAIKTLNYIPNERSCPLSAKFPLEYRQLIYLN